MQVNWVIENFTKEPSYLELAEAVKKAGHPLTEIKGDFKLEMLYPLYRTPNFLGSCIVFNGSIEMAKLIRSHLPLPTCNPVIYATFNNYLCSRYYSYFGEHLFNDKYVIMSLREMERNKFWVYSNFGKEAIIFIRPDSGDKPFQAQLLDLLDFDSFFKQNEHIQHELVIVSTPKNITWEGRFIVDKYKNIIACSTYRFQGQKTLIPSVPQEALRECEDLLKINYIPDSVYCMDLCQDSDRNTYLLELTSFSSAGLYASNKDEIVEKVSKIALEDYEEGMKYMRIVL